MQGKNGRRPVSGRIRANIGATRLRPSSATISRRSSPSRGGQTALSQGTPSTKANGDNTGNAAANSANLLSGRPCVMFSLKTSIEEETRYAAKAQKVAFLFRKPYTAIATP